MTYDDGRGDTDDEDGDHSQHDSCHVCHSTDRARQNWSETGFDDKRNNEIAHISLVPHFTEQR